MSDQFTLATYRKSDNSIVYTLFEGDQQHSLEIPVRQLVSAHDLPTMVKHLFNQICVEWNLKYDDNIEYYKTEDKDVPYFFRRPDASNSD